MRAVVIRQHGGPEVLNLEDVPDPAAGPGEVVVRVKAVALNHLDLWVRKGLPGAPFHLPAITGADAAGTVHAVGPEIGDLSPGEPVMVLPGVSCGHCALCVAGQDHLCARYGILGESCDGALAELVKVPRANVVRKPDNLSFEDAAAMSLTFLTSWHMLTARAELRGGETVLVQAAGSGVSSAAIQIAKMHGARVIATTSTEEKAKRARELGADEVILYTTQDFALETKRLTDKRGADLIIEHVGGEVLAKSVLATAWGGRVVTCGATTGFTAEIDLRHVFFRQVQILGSTMGPKGDLFGVLRHVDAGRLRPVVDRVMPLWRADDAHRSLEAREVFGKIVLAVD